MEESRTPATRASGPGDSDQRFVAFESGATHLVIGDTNRAADIFLYDRGTKDTVRISVGMNGVQANGGSFSPEITSDGRLIAYESMASNLVADDTNRQRDIFVYDRLSKTTTRVSVTGNGEQANNFSQSAHFSADGRFVVFESLASKSGTR
jgi:Tol biopolymer transport system component